MDTSCRRARSSFLGIRRALFWAGVAALPALSSLAFAATIPDDPAGKAAFGALTKLAETPHHQYISSDDGSAGANDGELISTDSTIYIKVHGKWRVSRMTPKQWHEQEKENISDAKAIHCEYERDEAVDGEATAVYKTHTENGDDSSESEIWVSKRSGLPLRMAIVVNGTTHKSIRIEYANIKAPPLG